MAPAEEVDIVKPVQEGLHRSWPVIADIGHELLENAAVNPVRVVAGSEQEWRQGRQQGRAPDAPGAIHGQVTGHFAGPHREAHQRHIVQVELGEQHIEVSGQRVAVIPDTRPARVAEAAPVVGDDTVPGVQQGRLLLLPRMAIKQVTVNQHDRSARTMVLVVNPDSLGILMANS